MSVSLWDGEAARYIQMPASERQQWLARLLFASTALARDTYVAGGEGVDDPVRMRRLNELMHRAAGQLRAQMESHASSARQASPVGPGSLGMVYSWALKPEPLLSLPGGAPRGLKRSSG
jgi:hypothetical protein